MIGTERTNAVVGADEHNRIVESLLASIQEGAIAASESRPVQRIVINAWYGSFGLSDAAYEKLIEWGVPVRAYKRPKLNPETGLPEPEPENDGEVIFDRELTPEGERDDDQYWRCRDSGISRYWDRWTENDRTHPLLLRLMDELGDAASGENAELKIVEIPGDVE